MRRVVWVLATGLLLAGGWAMGEGLPVLVPAPQQMVWTSGEAAWMKAAALTAIALPDEASTAQAAVERLRERLGAPLPVSSDGNLRIVLEDLPKSIPAKTRPEAYQLIINADGATLTAETPHGAHHGLVTLAELFADGQIPCVTLLDWPDQQMRGTYVPGIGQAEERFDQFVALKLNLLLLEDGQLYDLDNPEVLARFKQLAERCRAHFIEFVPELQSLGWGHFVLQREPRCVEARWVAEEPFPVKDGRVYSPDPGIPPVPPVNNASFEAGMDGWKADTHRGKWGPSTEEDAQVVPAVDGREGSVLRLVSEGTNTVRIEQDVDVQPNARYELRCLVKTQGVTGRGAMIEIYGVEKSGRFGEFLGRDQFQQRGDTGWELHHVQFETGAHRRARPGGSHGEEAKARPYERVRVFLRIQEGAGTAWFDEIEVQPLQAMNPLANAVVTEKAKVVVQSEDGRTAYEQGRDYTLEVAELQYPFEKGEPLGVTLTADSRIKNGDTVLLSFNQAAREDITCCPSEPLYQAFLRKAIHDVIRELKPAHLHIGHDEPRFFNRDQRCTDLAMTNEALFVDDIKRTREFALEADPGIRIMMWDDAVNPYQNGPSLDTPDAAKHLPKDIIMNIWWYGDVGWEAQMDKSLAYFLDLGYDVTGSPWFRIPNAHHWAELFNEHKKDPKALGIIYTSWATEEPWAALEFTAEHAWSFGKPAYTPEP